MTCCGMLLMLPNDCECEWPCEEGGDVDNERDASESAALELDGAGASLKGIERECVISHESSKVLSMGKKPKTRQGGN